MFLDKKKETKAINLSILSILRDIKNLFQHEEEENYYELVKLSNFEVKVILNTKATATEI